MPWPTPGPEGRWTIPTVHVPPKFWRAFTIGKPLLVREIIRQMNIPHVGDRFTFDQDWSETTEAKAMLGTSV